MRQRRYERRRKGARFHFTILLIILKDGTAQNTAVYVLSGIWLTPLSPSLGNLVRFLEVSFCRSSSSGLSTLALLTPADRG